METYYVIGSFGVIGFTFLFVAFVHYVLDSDLRDKNRGQE